MSRGNARLRATTAHRPPSWLGVGLLLVLGAMAVLYAPALGVLPAGDDFGVPIAEIQRGNIEGPLALVARSQQATYYRPVQSLLTWAVGQWNPREPWPALHAATFAAMALYLGVFTLWLGAAPLGWTGRAVALAVFLFHPVLPAQLASLDGLSSLLAPAAMWLGVWCVYRFRDRLTVGLTLGLAMLAVGAATKEYSFGIVPLATLAVLCLRRERRWRGAVATGLVMGLGLLAWMAARRWAMPEGAELGGESLSAWGLVRNTALFVAALLSFGNTVPVYVWRTPVAIAVFAGSWAVTAALLSVGAARRWRVGARPKSAAQAGPEGLADATARRWLTFSVLAIFGAMFPANLLSRTVSEMYMAGQFLPLALLAGLAAEGWAALSRRSWRWAAAALAVGQLALGVGAVHAKVASMAETGRRARRQLDQVAAHVPAEARDWRIGLVFPAEAVRGRYYTVYHMLDIGLVGQKAVEWRRYGRGHRVYYIVADAGAGSRYHARQVIGPFNEPAHERLSAAMVEGAWTQRVPLFDVTLVWDPQARTFLPVGPEAPTAIPGDFR